MTPGWLPSMLLAICSQNSRSNQPVEQPPAAVAAPLRGSDQVKIPASEMLGTFSTGYVNIGQVAVPANWPAVVGPSCTWLPDASGPQ